VSTEAEKLHRIISASVRDMLDAYRIQAQSGPVTDKALEEILFRAAHEVVQSLATCTRDQRAALLPSVVRMLLAAFIEEIAATDQANLSRPPGGPPHDLTPAVPRRHRVLRPARRRHVGFGRVRVGAVECRRAGSPLVKASSLLTVASLLDLEPRERAASRVG
jgi:hypothetical protein